MRIFSVGPVFFVGNKMSHHFLVDSQSRRRRSLPLSKMWLPSPYRPASLNEPLPLPDTAAANEFLAMIIRKEKRCDSVNNLS